MSKLKSSHIILKDYEILIECHSGNLNLKSYIDFVKRTTLDPVFSKNMNYLIDLRDVVLIASLNDIEKYNNFTETEFETIKKRKVAIITNTPNQMVFSTLFKNLNSQKLKEIEIFSTHEIALNWLAINNLSIEKVNLTLEKLKKEVLS